ncbi:hypothetical protein BDA99DRAFT_576636 [Phascolomyces articulosus]|uniref:RING-type domain-containing protein n=1 Tax=Phascolomyces articulosus TaxID=60185 RepID=A0AAD5JMI5_9FUNG|nr:hypothetical protein BDA99DRAFT_576636 [Phascolomyces articulosus]
MPQFWSRVLHPFRHGNNKKQLGVTTATTNQQPQQSQEPQQSQQSQQSQKPLLPDNSNNNNPNGSTTKPALCYSSPSCLIESEIYRDDLVKIDILENALEKNDMETFFCTWNEELERIYEKCRWALDSLTCTIDELSHEICTIASPLQNPDRRSLCDVHQFISSYLKEWQGQHQRTTTHTKGGDGTNDLIAKREAFEISSHQSSFDTYFDNLQSKILATEDPALSHCIQQVCQWEYNFFLYKQYSESQMMILWDTIQYQDIIQRLLQTRWNRRYNQCINTSQALEDRIKTLLEQSSPAREDFTCAICLSVLSEPVTIAPCLHTFCRPCIQHLYCTCTLASCSSPCHRASRRQRPEQYYYSSLRPSKNMSRRSSQHQPSSFQQQQQQRDGSSNNSLRRGYSNYRPIKRHSSISYSRKKQKLLACQCYPNNNHDLLSSPKHHSCPLCRSPFTIKDCTINVALDNFISLYFPYEEKVDDKQHQGNGITRRGSTAQGNNDPSQKRRSAIYTAVQQLWSSSKSSRVEQSTSGTREGELASRTSNNNNDTNEPIPRSRHTRHQHRNNTNGRPESSAVLDDDEDEDFYNIARSSWWF